MALDDPRARPARRAPVRRLAVLLLVAAGLAPGTFLRAPGSGPSEAAAVTITPLAVREGVSGPLTLTGVWELRSPHGAFGGFSALAAVDGSGLIAGTDRGFLLDIDLPATGPRAVQGSFRFVGINTGRRREIVDLESLARDPAGGTLWAGFESENLVMRLDPDGTRRVRAPAEMARWRRNSGAETMERLADGRFLVIAEGAKKGSGSAHEALLFPGDPVKGGLPITFSFSAPADYEPVDAAQLPDSRVLILLRRVRYALPARFDTAIAIADPCEIRTGEVWRARVIERLSSGIFADNFEGIAFTPSPEDPARGSLWLISDDNFSAFQRSLLVRFDWDPRSAPAHNEKAPGNPGA